MKLSSAIRCLLMVIAVPTLLPGCGSTTTLLTDKQPPPPRGYVAYYAAGPIVVDGDLNEPAWQNAAWTADFVDIEGSLRPAPRFRTRAKMTWDDNALYIGAELQEPDVWGTLTKRDTVIFYDDDFEVFIDPNGDNFEYYEFEMNALNTVWDLFLPKPYRDEGSPHNDWNIIGLKTAVRVHGTINNPADIDSGWTVEIAMPWTALGEFAHRPAPPHDGDQWRINFSRVEWKVDTVNGVYHKLPGMREDNWVWSPQWMIDMHQPELWGYVQFDTGSPGSRLFKSDPTWPARIALYQVYKAERSFRRNNGRYALSLQDLGFSSAGTKLEISIEPRPQGYTATARLNGFVVRETEDSRCWVEGQ
ncbi:MAG TPA: carbohydrate-binding family 9-like protein [Bacteroidota bacterium]|nr:carbohydrate-binding family 9-like protein [Bacteroidota bacterium]